MFADQLRRLRSARNISQSELAATLGVSQQAVTKWENNKSKPSLQTVKKIAQVFDVSTDYLLDNEGKKEEVTEDEKQMLEEYRQLDDEGKNAFHYMLNMLTHLKQSNHNNQMLIQNNNHGNMYNVNGSNNYLTVV